MSNQLKHTELIDAYLTDQLSPEESGRFMQLLEKDPALQEEFKLQQETLHSIREHRRMQLKARLDAIEVGTGYSAPSATALKLLAGAALVGALSVGGWFGYQQLQENSSNDQPQTELIPAEQHLNTLESQKEESEPNSLDMESREDISSPSVEETETSTPRPADETVSEQIAAEESYEAPSARKESKPENKDTDKVNTVEPTEINTSRPDVVKPDVLSVFDEPDAVDSVPEADVPADKLKEVHSFSTQNIEVTTKTDKDYTFHYMFHDNQLHIYGDFSKVPYEVLEVNSGRNIHYYLYHGGAYYELNPNQQKIVRLKELTNEKIIQELEITRTQKLNR